jgi:hypothetical protein
MKWVLPCLVCWAGHAGQRDFYPALAALVAPVQNIFILTVQYFTIFVPIAQQAGGEWPCRCDLYCDGRSIPLPLPTVPPVSISFVMLPPHRHPIFQRIWILLLQERRRNRYSPPRYFLHEYTAP